MTRGKGMQLMNWMILGYDRTLTQASFTKFIDILIKHFLLD